MNHQVQGMVLVDNEWVSRPVDVYQIMAQSRKDDAEIQEPPAKTTLNAHNPPYGLLSRTVLPTPLYKFILPANIRHRDFNDVVLVGEDSIQLNEVYGYGRLRNVAVKSDFSGRILAARVFGESREIRVNTSVSSPQPGIKIASANTFSSKGCKEQSIPPEMVVLTLTSRTLMFLWAQRSADGISVFQHRAVKLPASSSRFDRLGQYLAVDPKHRAMAVGAYEGRFILYKTKSMQTWRDELYLRPDSTPIEDERIMFIEGRIMHMEFLTSAVGTDDYHVVLLLIIAHQGLTKLTCFDWDCRYDLSTVTARTERVAVDLDDQNPSLLIPLTRSPDFLLIYDTHVSVYKDVLSGAPQRSAILISDHIAPPLRPGDSTHRPLWVQWDRTPRHPDFHKECFYLAREDGRIMYLEMGPAGAVDMDAAGEWPYRIDTAFACLNTENLMSSQPDSDVIITGAAGNDGLVCRVGASPMKYSYSTQYPTMNQFTLMESISNWSPVTSLCITEPPRIKEFPEQRRCAIFVANGTAPHGQVSELRYGLRAAIDGFFGEMDGCTDLWVLQYGSHTVDFEDTRARQHYIHVLVSLPLESLLFRLIRTHPDLHGNYPDAWDDCVWDITQLPSEDEPIDDGLVRAEETISACMLSSRYSIQITRKNAQLLAQPTLALCSSFEFPTPILLAASRPDCHFVPFAFKDDGHIYLDVLSVLENGLFVKKEENHSRHALSADPTCIELLDIAGQTHIFVGTFDSRVWLFRVSSTHRLSQVFRSTLDPFPIDCSRTLCEGAAILTSDDVQTLVCATRDGLLLSRDLRTIDLDAVDFPAIPYTSKSEAPPSAWGIVRMGSVSAQIYASSTDRGAAFVSCGADFCQVRLSPSSLGEVGVESIWLTDRPDPGYLQRPVTAVYQLPCMRVNEAQTERDLSGFFFAISGKQMLCAQLEADQSTEKSGRFLDRPSRHNLKPLPRKMITGAKPSYATYLALPKKMLVATVESGEECAPPDGYRGIHSCLKLLNMHDESTGDVEVKQEVGVDLADRSIIAQYMLNKAERVYSIVDWAFEDDRGKKYNLVIVGTGIREGPGRETGRRIIFNLGQRGSRLSFQKASPYSHPVYSIAMFDRRATVSVIGQELHFDEFDSSLGKWIHRGSKGLPSPGIHITVSLSTVYVSTLQHSLLCFEVARQLDSPRVNFEQLFTDSRERSLTHHLVLRNSDLDSNPMTGHESLVLLTDKKTASVTGLYSAGESTLKSAANTLFEACLPRTVIRLHRGNVRPSWRQPARSTGDSQRSAGILVDDVIGACSDGTIYAFAILLEPARHVLRLLQNLIELKQQQDPASRFTIVKHRSGDIFNILMSGADGAHEHKIRARDVDPRYEERGASGSRKRHIDGDRLMRYFEEGGELQDLVTQGVDDDVQTLFVELAQILLPQGDNYVRDGEKSSRSVALCVREWLKEILTLLL